LLPDTPFMMRTDLSTWARALNNGSDVLVIGGGATGLGVALQAVLEGRSVVLVEARDFACGTSSRSTKLLHGGVRYLAQGRIRMVRQALRERAIVLQLAPHLAQPLPFVVAERSWFAWAITTIGLKLYQWLSGRLGLGATQVLRATELSRLLPDLQGAVAGVRYWDGQFDDARLALALARTAHQAGARLRNHTRVVGLRPLGQGWIVTLQDRLSQTSVSVYARNVVNATGVWVDAMRSMASSVLQTYGVDHGPMVPLVQPSQGVHLVVSRSTLPISEAVLVPRTSDGRVLFAIPWLGATVIGTTDTPRTDMPLEPRPTHDELQFLFGETERALGVRLTPADVLSVWVGLRSLVEPHDAVGPTNTSAISREHLITREAPGFVTVTGGKWTTYRAMAEQVMAAIVAAGDLPAPDRWADTRNCRLWGAPSKQAQAVSLREAPGPHLLGAAAQELHGLPGHNNALGLGLTEAMVRYFARQEWAVTVEDLLARRWRVLFLDARAAANMAPRVAQLLQEETGIDPELNSFLTLCRQYRLQPDADSTSA
jgi:glycerol-3-phosphate dehydrogenase